MGNREDKCKFHIVVCVCDNLAFKIFAEKLENISPRAWRAKKLSQIFTKFAISPWKLWTCSEIKNLYKSTFVSWCPFNWIGLSRNILFQGPKFIPILYSLESDADSCLQERLEMYWRLERVTRSVLQIGLAKTWSGFCVVPTGFTVRNANETWSGLNPKVIYTRPGYRRT